jgi:enoyl-CoA hydratase/3-hydroxyacyl-CoA dehydrogenase
MVDITDIKTLAVIGAGTMGREIAQVAMMSGIFKKVVLNDIDSSVLENARLFIENGLKKLEEKGKLMSGTPAAELMKVLFMENDLKKAVSDADFVIEAVPELMDLKQELFRQLGEYSPEHAILATNTSTMSITEIASTSGRDDKVIGMHFFTPIVVLRLIEVIRGQKTSDDTFEKCVSVGEKLPALKGKKFIAKINKESPGFIVNRLTVTSNLYLDWLLDEAVEKGIPFEAIDADIGTLPGMGPCARLDYLGLDIVYNALKYFETAVSPEFAPGKTLSERVKRGNLGRKTGFGLYKWKDGKPVLRKVNGAGLFDPEMFLAIQLNEGCKLLEEGIVSGYKMIDDTMMAGMDMPGPFGAGKRNYPRWTMMLEEFVEKSGIQYLTPCELMKTGGFIKMRK